MEQKNIDCESKREGRNFTLSIKRIKRTTSSCSTTDEIKQVVEGSNTPCSPSIRSPLRIIKGDPRPSSPFLDTFGLESPVCSPTIRSRGNSPKIPLQDENQRPNSPAKIFNFDRKTIRSSSPNRYHKENTSSPNHNHRGGIHGEKPFQSPHHHTPNRRNRFSFVSDDCGSPSSPRSPFHYIHNDGHLTPHGIKPHSPCIDRDLLEQLEQMSPKPFREEDISSVVTNTYRKCELDDNDEICEIVTESICVSVHSRKLDPLNPQVLELYIAADSNKSFRWDVDKANVVVGGNGAEFIGWDLGTKMYLADTGRKYLYFDGSSTPSKMSPDGTVEYYNIKCKEFAADPFENVDDERTIFVERNNKAGDNQKLVYVYFFSPHGTNKYYLYYEENEDILYACNSIAKATELNVKVK